MFKKITIRSKMPITCKLVGGLGNQMFQVAVTFAHAKKIKSEAIFPNSCQIVLGRDKNYNDTIFKNIKRGLTIFDGTYYKEPSYKFVPIPNNDNLYLDGYFQSYKYFDEYRDDILELFNLSNVQVKSNSVSLHIRRGDYSKFPDIHPILPLEYYKKALDFIKNRTKIEYVYVFSDDIEWCKQNLSFGNLIFVDEKDYVSISMMAKCDHNIVANSSFSWWGSYLNQNPNKIIVYPSLWFGPKGPKYDLNDLFDSKCFKIDF